MPNVNEVPPADSPWFPPNGAANYLKISTRSLWRMIESGKLPCHRVGTRIVRLHRDDLDAVMGRVTA